MKILKPRAGARTTAADALRIATAEAPALPPARIPVDDRPSTLNLRLRMSTITALTAKAKAEGLTQKQVVCLALAASGMAVAAADLEDRTPRRKP